MVVPYVDLFKSIQGEGKYTGVPSIFIRVSGCNLRCVFKNSICDTAYSSFTPEKSKYTDDDIIKFCEENSHINHIVITGGEPLLYKDGIKDLIDKICAIPSRKATYVTIETNGTLPGINLDDLQSRKNTTLTSLFYSISPKLSTSVDTECRVLTKEQADHHNERRINIVSLSNLVMSGDMYQLKFVYSGKECIDEIKDILSKISQSTHIPVDQLNNAVMLMPEGQFEDQVRKSAIEAVDVCINEGWTLSHRVHILIWGDKRAV